MIKKLQYIDIPPRYGTIKESRSVGQQQEFLLQMSNFKAEMSKSSTLAGAAHQTRLGAITVLSQGPEPYSI